MSITNYARNARKTSASLLERLRAPTGGDNLELSDNERLIVARDLLATACELVRSVNRSDTESVIDEIESASESIHDII